jgi:hypothetical protein
MAVETQKQQALPSFVEGKVKPEIAYLILILSHYKREISIMVHDYQECTGYTFDTTRDIYQCVRIALRLTNKRSFYD